MSAPTEFVKPGCHLEEQALQQLGRIESLERTLDTVTSALQQLSPIRFSERDLGLFIVTEAVNSFFVRLFVREDAWVLEKVHEALKAFQRVTPLTAVSFEFVSHLRYEDVPSGKVHVR